MQLVFVKLAIVFGLCCLEAKADQHTASPLPKVVKLLKKLKETLVKDGETETKEFHAYSEWCRKKMNNLKYEIKSESEDREDEQAIIAKSNSDISIATTKIDEESGSMDDSERALQKAEAVRAKDKQQFKVNEKELMNTVESLERATNVLQRKLRGAALIETKVDRRDLKSLMETFNAVINAASLSLHDQNKLTALVQASEDEQDGMAELGAPSAAAYNSHSASILDMLEDLKQKAGIQLTKLRKEEQNAAHNFNMLKGSLTDEIAVSQKEMGEAKADKTLGVQAKAGAHGDLSVTSGELGSDKKSFSNTNGECHTLAEEYEASVKSRAEEMSAIDQGLEVLGQVPAKSVRSFLQLQNPDAFQVVNMLRTLGEKQRSAALTQLAGRVSSALTVATRRHSANPFKKVSDMISAMLEKLQKEGGEEAKKKAYCDAELKDSKAQKAALKQGIDKVAARIDSAKAKTAALKGELATLQEELSTLAAEKGEADKLRRDQSDVYKSSKVDFTQGIDGVRMAMKILRKYYQEENKEEALLQRPPVFSHSAHKGTGDSVISILEVVEADMAESLSKLESEETESVRAHEKMTKENNESRIIKEQAIKYKSKAAVALEKALVEHGSDLDGEQTQMDAVLEYAENLKGMCQMKTEESYEERVRRREAEIEGLNDALAALESESSFLQRAASFVPTSRHSSLRGL